TYGNGTTYGNVYGNGHHHADFSETAPTRTFTIHLPQRASVDTAEVWIDRQPAQYGTQLKRLSANVLQVTLLPTSQPRQPQTVEIRYQFNTEPLQGGGRDMEIPYVKDSTWIRGLYWQLILPSNMHLFQAPTGFALEYRWGWGPCFWGRLPIWEQETLERWSGAVTATPVPLRMNRYVLAGMGSNETLTRKITVGFVNRTTLVTIMSLAVFLLGILFLYLKILSRPLPRLILFIILGAFAIRFPEFALLGLQAATLGVLLFFVSVIFGLKQKFRRKMFVYEPSEENTVHHEIVVPTIIAPAEGSEHAFKTITYEQDMGVASSNESTIFRK
ncbi:MAG: hypothetical protein Q4C70_14340, partial [Planctomycetia bacterium]|nr:hypothetical protein [Planctomycetia bacterium]